MAKIRKPKIGRKPQERRNSQGQTKEQEALYEAHIDREMAGIRKKLLKEKKLRAKNMALQKSLPKVKTFEFLSQGSNHPRAKKQALISRNDAYNHEYKDWQGEAAQLKPLMRNPSINAAAEHQDKLHRIINQSQMQFQHLHFMQGAKGNKQDIWEIGWRTTHGDETAGNMWDVMREQGGGFDMLPSAQKMVELGKRRTDIDKLVGDLSAAARRKK